MFRWLFGSKKTDYERGKRTATEFLAGNPTQLEMNQYWSSACEDEGFSCDGFAKATKLVFRQSGFP